MLFTYTCGHKPLEGYTIKRAISRGGFGEVYFGLTDGGKEVALKCLFRHQDTELRGVSQCLNLKHAHLVHLYDLKKDPQGNQWLVMEYVRGETLHAVLQRFPQGLEKDMVCQWFGQLAEAVHYLHEQGIVHRDLKPANVFVENGLIKVGDYGLCKVINASQHRGHTQNIGTLHYMAPEMGKGEYSRSVDIYAAGILLFELLTGKVPFDGETSAEILFKHLSSTPDLTRTGAFAPVIARALEKDPARRFGTMAEMGRRVAEIGRPQERLAPVNPTPIRLTLASQPTFEPVKPAETTVLLPAARPLAETAHMLFMASIVAIGLSFVWAYLFRGGDWQRMTPSLYLTVVGSWALLLLSRFWKRRYDDSLTRRLAQGAVGAALGLFALWLQGYQFFPFKAEGDLLRAPPVEAVNRHPFFGALYANNHSFSILASHLAYYGLMLIILRWWSITDERRTARFSTSDLLVAAFWAFVLLFLLPSALEREIGFAAMVMMSAVMQLASPRVEPAPRPSRRLRLRHA